MAASDVYAALNAAIISPGRSIDLWAAANGAPALADLVPVLGLFGINSAYVLTQADLAGDNRSVTLTASGVFGQPGAATANTYAIAATLTYTDSARFTLTLRVVDSRPWTFATFFPMLPDSERSTVDTEQARGIRWTTSFLKGARPGYEVVVNSPSFIGRNGVGEQLRLLGFLPEFADPDISNKLGLLSPWPLRLEGSLQMPATINDFPLMLLTAQGSSTNMLSGSKIPGVEGPDPFSANALSLNISVDRLTDPVLGHTGYSSLLLSGQFTLGGGLSGVISTRILSAGRTWSFSAQFDPTTSSLTQGLASLTRMFGVELPIPMDFPLLSKFHFAEVDVELWNAAAGNALPQFSLRTFALSIKSNEPWVPPVPFVSFKDVGIRWVWGSTLARNPNTGRMESIYLLTGTVFGSIQFGGNGSLQGAPALPSPPMPLSSSTLPVPMSPDGSVTIDVLLSIPSFYISGAMRDGDYIPIGRAFADYFGGSIPLVPANMNVTALSFTADPIGQVYGSQAQILFGTPESPQPDQAWTIMQVGTVGISLERLEMWIQARGGRVGGGIAGVFFLKGAGADAYDDPQLRLSAKYPLQGSDDPKGWLFAAQLYPGTSIDLTQMVARFIKGDPSYQVPDYVPHLLIDRMDATFATGTGAYTFGGTASMRWNPELFGTTLSISASASADIARTGTSLPVTGTLAGSFAVNKIAIMVAMDIGVAEPTYLFKVMFGELWAQAVTAWRGEENQRHQVVSVQLGGITLGDILEYLVNLAAPTLGFSLDPPWDLLKRVDLSRFVLTLDPQENVVEFVFNAEVDLGVMRVDTVGARYRRGTGQGKVELILTGNFFGQSYSAADPLSWDVVDGTPPSVPGQGSSTVDLRFLGIGQRVTFGGPTPDTVAASIAALRAAMKKPEPGKDPLAGTGLVYADDSQWLMGLDIGLLNTLDLGIIFNDPKLYGLSIALGGERAGSLAGLRFEILYKKITNDIGMYRIELRVPDAFRTIQLGAVSLTLGIAVIEIYTNGNFKIDLGFPYNRDYSRSFSLQAGIFIGRGGFYFGVLNGDTSTSVPKITNGNFSPVIELGVGLAAGVGREINVGILSGGAYVQIEVIFQGVLAWFNPTSSGGTPATYYRAQGIVTIHGKVYGRVDFVIISASVTLEAFAQAMVVFESYRPILLDFSVGVRAEASVKILFIRISFHFSVTLEMGFTIGSSSPTPWILANGSGGTGATRADVWLSVPRHAQRRALMRQGYMTRLRGKRIALGLSANDSGYLLDWQPAMLVFGSQQSAALTMLPYITVGQVPVDWAGGVPVNANPDYRLAFLLYADTGMAPDAKTVQGTVKRSARLSNNDPLPADLLVTALMRYALYALPDGPSSPQDSVNAAQLALLAEQLSLPETATAGFAMSQLNTFFHTNLKFLVGGVPAGPMPADKGAMLFPMPPGLAWTSPQAGARDFSTYNAVGAAYEAGVSAILDPYFPVNGGVAPAATDDPAQYESFAIYLFRDFCQMLVKAAINEAQKQLTNAPVTLTGSMSLADAAKTFATAAVPCIKEAGDTVQSVAVRVGATAAELLFLNPGIEQNIADTAVGSPLNPAPLIGVSPEMLAQDNPGITLKQAAWSLGNVSRAVGSPDIALSDLAALFNIANVASLFAYTPPPGSSGYTLGQNPNLLEEGRSFALPAQTFSPPANGGFDLNQTAALFFVRYADPDLSQSTLPSSPDMPVWPDMPAWYAQAIAILNPSLSAAMRDAGESVEIDPGTPLSVPLHYGDRSTTRAYTTVAGDTLHRIGSMLVLCQDSGLLHVLPPQWTAFKQAVTSSGTNFGIPAWPLPSQTGGIAILSGETAESLTRRLIVDASFAVAAGWSYDWNAVSMWLGPAKVLSPLAVVMMPGASISDKQAFTFQSLADTYGLALSEVAQCLQDHQGLLPDPSTLIVKQLPVMTVAQIEQGVLDSTSFAGVVNQASQMLMSGLRLPGLKLDNGHVVPDADHPLPLYDLSGQQFSLAVNTDPTHGGDVALTMTVTSAVDWVQFGSSFTVESDHDIHLLGARHSDLIALNPRLSAPDGLQPGMVLFSSVDLSSLDFSFTNQQILNDAPATGLKLTTSPATPPAPSPLPLKGTAPNTYSFEYPVTLQTTQALPIPTGGTPMAGYASLWPFPQGLLQRAAESVATPYDIFAGSQPGATVDQARALLSTTYGCQLSFRIRRMDDGSSRFQLLGVDTDQRGLLLALRDEILHSLLGGATKAYLAVTPAPNASNAQGLALLDPNIPCFIIKTNLSTDSQPQPDALRAKVETDPTPVYYADFLTQLADFLLLLWEGSVVGGTGYYLGLGKDLPGSAFDGQGVAGFTLLAIAGGQQAVAPTGRTLEVYNNCLLVAPGLDASIQSLYAEGTDNSDLSEIALTPPGNAGFSLTIDTPSGQDSQSALQDRYNTLVFWCADAVSPYTIPAAWTPALPKPSDGQQLQAWERQRIARRRPASAVDDTPSPYWHFEQVIPFYRFTTVQPLAVTQGLPEQANDPYWGFGSATSCPHPTITFCMSDLLGNHSQAPATAGQGVVDLKVGYTDELIGLSQWPELAAYFEILGTPGQASLVMQLGLKAAASVPSSSQRGDAAVNAAQQQSDKYAQLYYQLIQSGVGASLATSLRNTPQGQAIDIGTLWRYAAGSYAYATAATTLVAVTAPGTKLSDLLVTYPVRYAEMAVANQDVPLTDLFAAGSQVAVPAFMPYIAQRSLTDLYAQRPQGWPDPGSPAALFSLAENADLPLAIGVPMLLPSAVTFSSGTDTATPSLAQLAATHYTDAGLLGEQNAQAAILAENNGAQPDLPNVLTADFVQADGTTVTLQVPVVAGQTDSFDGAQSAFATQGANLSVTQIAAENAGIVGLLKPNQTLSNNIYVTQALDTPSHNNSGVTTQALGNANALTPGIFDDGALVQFGSEQLALSTDTLNVIAQRYACPAELLLSSNAMLDCGGKLAVPGCFAWSQDAKTLNGLRVPYTVQTQDLLATLCTRFAAYAGGTGSASVDDCVNANADLSGTLAQGVTIHIQVPSGDVTITTLANASFSSTLVQAQAINSQTTMNQLAAAIASLSGALQVGALLLFPRVRLPTACAPKNLAALYGVDGASFSLANTATLGLLANGITLNLPDPGNPDSTVSVTTQANDTFNTVIVRFSVQGVATDAGAIALGNPDAALFVEYALALLPPASVREQVPLGSGGPYPQTVFGLNASLTLARPVALVHPDFDVDGPVARVSSPLAPHAQGDAVGAGSLNFGPFIAALTKAIPDLRVGTAKVAGETSDLWCVDFSSTGIASVSLIPGVQFPSETPMPRFLALPPLYDHLVTRKLDIKGLNDDGTLNDVAVPTNFMAIDAEPWAQRFLSDLDRFLGGAMATILYTQTGLRDTLSGAIGDKYTIAGAIAEQLQGVFNYSAYTPAPDPNYQKGVVVARDALRQQLYVNLLKAYDTSVIAQYDTQSTTPWTGGVGVPTVSLFGQPRLADTGTAVTFAAAKTGFDPARAFVSFFATVADPERHSSVRGTLEYAYSHTEFDISQAGVPTGYEASNWLSFIPLQDKVAKPTALQNTNPGALLAPVPLRTYPSLPAIREQAASPTYALPDSLAKLPLWTYKLTCTHEFAAQDSVNITADFNLAKPLQMRAALLTADLFSALAQYVAVADQLWTLMGPLTVPGSNIGATSPSVNAAKTFGDLVATIASSWHIRLPQQANSTAPEDSYIVGKSFAFDARVTYSENGLLIKSFSLTRQQDQPGPASSWPQVEVILPDGVGVPLQAQVPLTPSATMVYQPVPGTEVPAQNQQTFRLAWNDISVSAYQNARARMLAVRNEDLLYDPAHPDNPVLQTSPSFLLKTAEVSATSIVTPLIERDLPQEITGVDLNTALADAVQTLFPAASVLADTTASWGVFYAYELVRDLGSQNNSLLSKLPVALYPNQPLAGAAGALAGAVQTWTDDNHPASAGGGWLFSVILYSGLESSARPLFSAELFYRIGKGG
ncbi:MAG TPA: hypothetical protein VNZ27_00075 [Rhodanobacter sp.]|nr:hypothetical protein [Rhodanobacter sp.]